jgi:hypothetical protein
MSAVENLAKRYEIGIPILEEFMKMTDHEIREKLKSIVGSQLTDKKHLLGDSTHIRRVIENETPSEITVSFYDTIEINAFGISYKGEYGYENKTLVEFNKHFKL